MFNFSKKSWGFIAAAVVLGLVAAPAWADDVTDFINEGKAQYEKGLYTEAAGSLEYAAQLIRQKKSGSLETFLPAPLPGWHADEASSSAVGSSMLGGASTAQRSYYKDQSSVTIVLITDSPALQATMMMLSNPAFAASTGAKLDRVNGQRAVVEYDAASREGTMTFVVDNRIMVTVNGDGVSNDEIKAYASAIDFDKLAAMP